MIIILPNDVDGNDRVDGRDDAGGRDDNGSKYFPTYFPSIHFLFLSFFDFSPSFFLRFSSFFFFFFLFFQNFRRIYMK